MDTATAEPTTQQAAMSDDQSASESFNAAMAASNAGTPSQDGNDPETKLEVAPVAKEKPAATKGEFPDAVLGTKLEPKAEDPDAILTREHAGQIRQTQFAEVKARALEHKKAAETLRQEVETLKSSSGKPSEDHVKELEMTRSELNRLRDTIALTAYERSDEFREKFTAPQELNLALAISAATESGGDAKLIEAMFSVGGSKGFKMLAESDLDDATRHQIGNLLTDNDILTVNKQKALGNSKERMADHQRREQAQAAEETRMTRAAEKYHYDQVVEELKAKHKIFQKHEGEDVWNAGIDERLLRAEMQFNKGEVPFRELAAVAIKANAFDDMERVNTALEEKNQALTKRVQELTAAGPQINGNGHRAASGNRPMTDEEHARQAWADAHRMAGQSR